jgi:hypothetical protein
MRELIPKLQGAITDVYGHAKHRLFIFVDASGQRIGVPITDICVNGGQGGWERWADSLKEYQDQNMSAFERIRTGLVVLGQELATGLPLLPPQEHADVVQQLESLLKRVTAMMEKS